VLPPRPTPGYPGDEARAEAGRPARDAATRDEAFAAFYAHGRDPGAWDPPTGGRCVACHDKLHVADVVYVRIVSRTLQTMRDRRAGLKLA
jgi:hypothetical protein